MRVKLGKRIYFCSVATRSNDSCLILLTTPNGVYTVNLETIDQAKTCHEQLLKLGYFDFAGYEYSN